MKSTVHRVDPSIAREWLSGELHPPGYGFTPMPRASRSGRLLTWTAFLATVAFLVSAVVSFVDLPWIG